MTAGTSESDGMARLPQIVLCNGGRIPPEDATLSVLGTVVYGAFGVYESMQLWNGVVFQLHAHLERLIQSARRIHLPLAADLSEHRSWIYQLIREEGVVDATIRLFAVGPERDRPPRTFLWLEACRPPSREEIAEGVDAVTFAGERAIPSAKSINTLVNTLARQAARNAGVHEGLLLNREGAITEGASSNFGVVQNGAIHLPPTAEILQGVTLETLLRIVGERQVEVVRRALPLAELEQWAGAFLTSTSRHLLPLTSIDGRPIGSGRPHPLVCELQQNFEAYFEEVTGATYPRT